MGKKYESEALMVCHQSAEGLHHLGIINDDRMKEFDEMCLAKETKIDHVPDASINKEHNCPIRAFKEK